MVQKCCIGDNMDAIHAAKTAAKDARAVLYFIVAAAGSAADNHVEDVAAKAPLAPSSDAASAAPSSDAASASARAIIRAENVRAIDATRALDDALVAENRAWHARIVASMMFIASREPAGPGSVYTLRIRGSLKTRSDPLTIDVAATSEGRAWVEMARVSRSFGMIVDVMWDGDVLTWAELKERINHEHPGYATAIARSDEDADSA